MSAGSGPDAGPEQMADHFARYRVYESWDGRKWFVLDTVSDGFVSGAMAKPAAVALAAKMNTAIEAALSAGDGTEGER